MLYEVWIVEPVGHVPKRFEFTRESPLHEGDVFLVRDLFFVVRRVRGARGEYDGAVEVQRMAAPEEKVVRRLGDVG